jgi:predicted acyl esterase
MTQRVLLYMRPFLWVVAFLAATTSPAQKTDLELADLERISDADTMVMVPMRDGNRLATDI